MLTKRKIGKWPPIPPSEEKCCDRCVASRLSAHLEIFNGIKLYMLFCNFSTPQYHDDLAVSCIYFYILFNGCMIFLHMCHILLNYC